MRINKKGFTLVEVLAVITILGIILVIAVPKINNYIDSNKKNTFIVNARNIIRQIEYDSIDFKTFSKIPLNDLDLKEFLNEDIDLGNSVVYSLDDKIYLDLAGTNQYKDLYLCGISNTNKNVDVQETPCEEQNFVYIDFSVDLDGGSTTQNFNTKYISGNYLVLQVPIKTNDTFLGWELVSGNSELDQNRIKFGTESTKIKAIWGNNPDFVVNLNGGTSNQKFDSKYSGGSIIVLQEPTREGYKFTGWKLVTGNAILSGNVLTTGTTNTVIEAIWELNEFAISYELNGGILGENAPTKGTAGGSVVVSNPSKEGYTFKGWDVVGTGASMSGTILTMGSSNIILVANWEINNYTISYNLNGGSAEGNPTNYTFETATFTLNNPNRTGYTFTGWTDGDGNDLGDFVTISKGTFGDKRYIANYTINTYTISYTMNGGTKGSSAPTSGTYGSTVAVSNPSRTGYAFTGWAVSGTGASMSGTNLTIGAGNITLTANWLNPVSAYSCANGSAGSTPVFTYTSNCTIVNDGNGNWRVKFLKSGTLTFKVNLTIDVFLVGGGGGGGSGYRSDGDGGVYGSGGGGGGGGYTKTKKAIPVTAGSSYPIIIGAGGTSTAGATGGAGGETSAFDLLANGGTGGGRGSGFTHPGGGGVGGNSGGAGGGGDGIAGGSYGSGATCEFGEGTSSGCTKGTSYAYSGGGGGGGSVRDGYVSAAGKAGTGGGGIGGTGTTGGSSGTTNTGGGGGGGSGRYNSGGAAGGSGVVVIRNQR